MGIRSKLNACVLAVSMLGIPVAAHAAGFGKMTVLSNLGQPLRAEIDLVSVQTDEASSLRVQLAAPDAFQERGVDYNSYLRSFRFEVLKRDNGQPYVRVTSSQSIGEPFVDFLVEMTWSGGRIVRQYTDVLDPAGYSPTAPATKTVAVTAPQTDVTSSPRATRQTPAAEPIPAAGKQSKNAVRQNRAGKKKAPKIETPVAAETSSANTPAPTASDAAAHKVVSGESLQKVASAYKPAGVSLDQMLLGLYKKNSEAFVKQNINRLKAGAVLQIPSKDEVSAVSKDEAAKEIRAHVSDWNSYKQGLAGHVAKSTEPKSTTKPSANSGKLVAKTEDKAAPAAKGPRDVVKLSKGETSDNASVAAKQRIKLLEEDSAAKEKALKEANERVLKLEKNIADMQHLLELKSKAAADLQKQAEAKAKADKLAAAAGSLKPATPKTEPAKVEAKPEPVKSEPVKPAKVETPEPVVKPVASAPKASATKAASATNAQPSAVESKVASDVQASPVAPAAEVKPKKPVETAPIDIAPAEEESAISLPLVGGGVAGLGLLGALFYFMRRRRARPTFEDSVLTGGDLKSNTVLGSVGASIVDTSSTTDNSFFTDFSREGLGSIDTDDVDPVAEAEVYMAYGRDAQAEEILKDALIKDGSRQEVRLKLMEIYAGRKNLANFELYATELHGACQGQGPLWEKAAAMGREIDPANSLYKADSSVDPEAKTSVLPVVAAVEEELAPVSSEVDLDFEIGTVKMQAMNFDAPAEIAPQDTAPEMDFDLGMPDAHSSTMSEHALNLNPDMNAVVTESDALSQTGVHDSPILDFQFDLGELPAEPSMPSFEAETVQTAAVTTEPTFEVADLQLDAPAEDEAVLDFSFGDINLDLNETETTPVSAPVVDTALAESSFEVGAEEAPSAVPSGLNFDLEDIDATSLDSPEDPIETKLDLANAYIDMGDIEGAKEILNETMAEGTDEQRQRAEKLLQQL